MTCNYGSNDLQLRFIYEITNYECPYEMQLQIINYLSYLDALMTDEDIKLQPIYLYLYDLKILHNWCHQVNKIQEDDYHISSIFHIFRKIPSNQLYYLIGNLIKISLYAVEKKIKVIYSDIVTVLKLNFNEMIQTTSIVSSDDKKTLVTEIQQSLVLHQHALVLHQLMEQQILLCLRQTKEQLKQHINGIMEVEISLRHLKYYDNYN